ncbi:MAG: YbgC/FadM family acyl-CoA thioesterase [Alphaproteobacteria bacterium]|nr:YbgC/FadM family acyl-CoA thioesterase [Alphaproteobacteria bacterium]
MMTDEWQNSQPGTGGNMRPDTNPNFTLDGGFDNGFHRYWLRVQYEDTDAGAIVYHAQYLAFAERARSAWLRCLGIDQPAMLANDKMGFVVRRIEIDFQLPARLGDVLEVESSLLRLGGASLKLHQKIINCENRHILARLVVDIGLVAVSHGADKHDTKPKICRLPAAVKAKFSGLAKSG